MKKVLFYIDMFDRTGAQRVMANLSFLLVGKDVELILVNDYSIPKNEEIDLPDKARRIILDDNNYNKRKTSKNFYRIKKLRKILKCEKPDFALSFLEGPNKKLLLASFGLKIKTIISIRCNPASVYKNKLSYFLVNILYSLSKHVVFQTKDASMFFWKSIQKKGIIINNSVNQLFFNTKYKGDSNNIVTLGRLEPEKNQKLLIDAFINIQDKIPDAELFIYGSGSLKEELMMYSSNRIHIIENISNVQNILEQCRVFVLCSNTEGMPNALMEALAVGVPSVSTDCPCGGPKMLIENGINGFLISCGDQGALEDRILELFSNKELRKQITEACKQKSMSFHPKKINEEWLSFFENISQESS